MKTFEDYLRDIHAETYTWIDDDMYDNFLDWLSDLDTEDVLEYGEAYGKFLMNK